MANVPKYLYDELCAHANDEANEARRKVEEHYKVQKLEVYEGMLASSLRLLRIEDKITWIQDGCGYGSYRTGFHGNVNIPRISAQVKGVNMFNDQLKVKLHDIIEAETEIYRKIGTRLRSWKNGIITLSLDMVTGLDMPKFDDLLPK